MITTDLDKLIKLASDNKNIIAIGTEGASNDSTQISDEWTDLDVTLFVREPAREDGWWWIQQLGEPTIVQFIETQDLFGPHSGKWFSWLTRYTGTRRIDFKMTSVKAEAAYLSNDTLNKMFGAKIRGESHRAKLMLSRILFRYPIKTVFKNMCENFIGVPAM